MRMYITRLSFVLVVAVFFVGGYQRLILQDGIERRYYELGGADFLLDDFGFAKLGFGLLPQRKNKLLVPLRPWFVARRRFELIFARYKFDLKKFVKSWKIN